ncbi:MAG: aspartate--ammonia ligase [Oscillospiraceae bacterium]|nr:aspartate--ammonia ligase [Oscillospiraceae bacterium]
MNVIYVPEGYKPPLSTYDQQRAIEFIKSEFQRNLRIQLHLKRVSAPLFVTSASGLNDNLNGHEKPVSFHVPGLDENMEIVHSLAKWKRLALKRYDFYPGNGLYCDMNAIRPEEDVLDNLHSVYVDQWDWEKSIAREERNVETLKATVRRIVTAICNTLDALKAEFPEITTELCRDVTFVTTQELEDRYGHLGLSASEKESKFMEDTGAKTVFLMQIGGKLKSGKPHDGRAPDYDDWSLNGDILFWNDILGRTFEISSMGIRVDAEAMDRQLRLAGCDDRRELPFHKMVLNDELPLTMGGGIGQSRLCMLLIGNAHIGEVQASIWSDETYEAFAKAGVTLL